MKATQFVILVDDTIMMIGTKEDIYSNLPYYGVLSTEKLIFVDGYKRPKKVVSLSIAVKVRINKNKCLWLQYPYYHTVVSNISDVIR